jgi:hypothetical protein
MSLGLIPPLTKNEEWDSYVFLAFSKFFTSKDMVLPSAFQNISKPRYGPLPRFLKKKRSRLHGSSPWQSNFCMQRVMLFASLQEF